MADLRNISSDHPLHAGIENAACGGFRGRVVHGGLFVAQASRLIGAVLPCVCVWTQIEMNFRDPLYMLEVFDPRFLDIIEKENPILLPQVVARHIMEELEL